MGSKKKSWEVEEDDVVEDSVVPPARSVPSTPRKVKRLTFDQWASRRGIKAHHKLGMRAFCGSPDKLRTEAAWDEIFSKY